MDLITFPTTEEEGDDDDDDDRVSYIMLLRVCMSNHNVNGESIE